MPFYGYSWKDIEDTIVKSGKNYNVAEIKRAYEFANQAHLGQKRQSGEAYISHPAAVVIILIELGMDTESAIAALLHDVVEDTPVMIEDIEKEFGNEVAQLVDAITKLGKIPYVTREEQQAVNVRKMFLAMAEDIRVIIIKLADRLHNMRTLSALPDQKQRDKARETLEIFGPIAHRLGIRAFKEELEDLAIQYLDPIAYAEIEQNLNSRKQYRETFLQTIIERIENRIGSAVENIHLEGRVKSIHGIYRKMYMQGKTFEEIYDIYAVRIITDTTASCYNILGFIHDMFRPIPGRFKDYISTPKPNMYQSLHTTLISREGIPFEVQIRTWEMHQTAEYGIAAHWKYKEGISKNDQRMEERLSWVRHLLENQKESDDVEEIVRTIKSDLTQEDVFAVTPKGDVISLPAGSTVIDFAYAIHSAVGNRMIGAKVDGRIVPIDHPVKTGEIIEILTTGQTGHGPSRDWLKMVKTSEARNKIRSWFKKERRAENIEEGKEELEREFKRNSIVMAEEQYDEWMAAFCERQHCQSAEDLYAAIGYGGISLSRLMPRIKEEYLKKYKPEPVDIDRYISAHKPSKGSARVIVEGMDDCLIKLSRCCDPLPGDPIIGYVTRGHGISVHKRDCNNVPRDMTRCEEPERWVAVHWSAGRKDSFKSTMLIQAEDREQLLADITLALSSMHVPMHSLVVKEAKSGVRDITITVSIENLEHLSSIISRMQKINGVYSVQRSAI